MRARGVVLAGVGVQQPKHPLFAGFFFVCVGSCVLVIEEDVGKDAACVRLFAPRTMQA